MIIERRDRQKGRGTSMVVEEGALEPFIWATAKKLHIFWPPIRAFLKQFLLVL
jgi:hypothetical protein